MIRRNIDVIKHDLLYCVNCNGHRIKFHLNVDKFVDELSTVFPNDKASILRFYNDIKTIYQHEY